MAVWRGLFVGVVWAAAVLADRPCDVAPLKGSPLCDTSRTVRERAEWVVGNLTEDESIALFSNGAGGVERLNLAGYQWWSEALHGVGHSPGVRFTAPTPYATSFPQVITTGAAFNKTLWHAIGGVISTEARAMNNVGNAGLTFWAPNINLIRDPRWGRGHETPGEDPYATSQYAANFVPGMQVGEDAKHIKASSCCKHYYAYDLENWGGTDRHHFDAQVTAQDEADTYLPAFHSCVANGKASGLMCSYNAVNGVPSCANGRILNGFARGKWGFEGYVTSDCGAVADVYNAHKYGKTEDLTCKDVLEAGMDSDCGGFLHAHLKASIDDKVTPLSAVHTALVNLFSVQIRLGLFDPVGEQPYLRYNYTDKVNTREHQQLALEAARQGVVLLKNDGGVLPFDRNTIRTVAVVGPNANATKVMQGNYQGEAPYLISPAMGVGQYAKVTYAEGCDTECGSTAGFGEAVAAAKGADATVVVVGISTREESEGHDRQIIALPGHQEELITQVAGASKGPVVVVVMAGGSTDFSVAKESTAVKGIVWVGYPGQSGGQALADVLFGTYNPGGRLPHTQYPKDYLNGLSMFDMGMRPNKSSGNPGRTYRFYTGTPVYAYGEGLSYTTFKYSSAAGQATVKKADVDRECGEVNSKAEYSATPSSTVLMTTTVTVTNTGKVAGSDVVMAFSKPPQPGQGGAPLKSLFGFERVFLQPGESRTVTFPVTVHAVSLVDETGARVSQAGKWTFTFGAKDELTVPVTIA